MEERNVHKQKEKVLFRKRTRKVKVSRSSMTWSSDQRVGGRPGEPGNERDGKRVKLLYPIRTSVMGSGNGSSQLVHACRDLKSGKSGHAERLLPSFVVEDFRGKDG